MGIFNDLRKNIVQKLIRPEDGYTFTGFNEGQPIKFYYQKNTNKYLIGMRSDNWYYFEPTLTGWGSYASKYLPWGQTVNDYTYDQEPEEIDFKQWIFGIFNNIYEQYSERLNNMSMKDVKKLTKRESKEDIMINKESFCDIVNALDKYWENMRKLECVLDAVFENNMLTQIYDAVVDALEEDLEPDVNFSEEEPMIYRWLLEFNAGRSEKAKEGIDGHPLTTAEELYDYLVWKKDMKTVYGYKNSDWNNDLDEWNAD